MTDKTTLCATILPGDNDQSRGQKIMERVVTACYESCREGRRELEAFPDFGPLLSELKSLSQGDAAATSDSYKVTSCLPCGSLVIRPQFFEQFAEMTDFHDLVDSHNAKFNKNNLTLSVPAANVPDSNGTKDIKMKTMETDEPIKADTIANLARAEILQLNSQISMVVDLDHEAAFFKADAEQCVLLTGRELFSFGAGSWFDGKDAKDMVEQGEGKWLKCHVNFDTPVCLERKKLPSHLADLECAEKACPLKDVLLQLEDAGEAWCDSILTMIKSQSIKCLKHCFLGVFLNLHFRHLCAFAVSYCAGSCGLFASQRGPWI
eukprot:Skav205778  [mRNA]  locus=scaffold1714:733504:734586:+ [translate_table: standard]